MMIINDIIERKSDQLSYNFISEKVFSRTDTGTDNQVFATKWNKYKTNIKTNIH